MKDEFELKLQQDFPFMRQNRVEGEANIYRRWGCEMSSGWEGVLREMCQHIVDRYEEDGIAIEDIDWYPIQIKEKFATMRVYGEFPDAKCKIAALDFLNTDTSVRFTPENGAVDEKTKELREDILQIIREAERQSASVCEVCGDDKTATVRMDMRWKRTLCDNCYNNYLRKIEENQTK